MNIIRGKQETALKAVIYGPEGIGKSTIASQFPDPLFIDTEGSTKHMDVARTEKPTSFSMLQDQVTYIREHPDICKTIVLDTADWAEQLCVNDVCARSKKTSIEDFGYGKGYVYLMEAFGKLLNLLEEVIQKGVHVVLLAHAKMRKFEQPDETGAYDRWELKLSKQVAPLVKEWADLILFANYKTYVINVDDQGAAKGKNKAQGGKRIMYTTHHVCWDAKNRHDLPEELPFAFASIAHLFQAKEGLRVAENPKPNKDKKNETATVIPDPTDKFMDIPETKENKDFISELKEVKESNEAAISVSEDVPKPLRDLMIANNVGEWDIQMVVEARGYYPSDTPIENYDLEFINGVLIAAWPQVFHMIQEMKNKMEVPFD